MNIIIYIWNEHFFKQCNNKKKHIINNKNKFIKDLN